MEDTAPYNPSANDEDLKLRLTADINYRLYGASKTQLASRLERTAQQLFSNSTLTGSLEATTTRVSQKIEEIYEEQASQAVPMVKAILESRGLNLDSLSREDLLQFAERVIQILYFDSDSNTIDPDNRISSAADCVQDLLEDVESILTLRPEKPIPFAKK